MIESRCKQIPPIDLCILPLVQQHLDQLTKPKESLGRLEDLAKKVAIIKRQPMPDLTHKVIFVMAGDHGVVDEGVSLFPQEVTSQMVYNFANGGAAINVLARLAGARIVVADMGVRSNLQPLPQIVSMKVAHGTRNMAKCPAMNENEAIKSIENGLALFDQEWEKGIDIVGTGEMGIGNTTAASAITAVITGTDVNNVTGTGTGIDETRRQHKVRVIQQAIEKNQPQPQRPIDILAKVGGFEIGGLVGIIIAAAGHKVPIVIDGFISSAAALLATLFNKNIKDYLIAAHLSAEQGHRHILHYLALEPILDLNLRLGEGTGAALAFPIIDGAVKILQEMATFADAGVSHKVF